MKRYPIPVKYIPKNKDKYVGDINNIVMRSSWEKKFAKWCDLNRDVLKWGSEIKAIPYFSSIDNCVKNYYVDFWLQIIDKDKKIRNLIIEIKPKQQIEKPKQSNKKKKITQINEMNTWIKNQDKWNSAKLWADKNNFEFIIMNEYSLGIKKESKK